MLDRHQRIAGGTRSGVPPALLRSQPRVRRRRHSGTFRHLGNLAKCKLVHHDASKYNGYRLTSMGYDFLAIRTLLKRGVIASVGRQIGVGKESDVFEVTRHDGRII